MGCHCGERRDRLAAAVKAVRAGRGDAAKIEIRAVGRSFTDDAKAFARDLHAKLGRR